MVSQAIAVILKIRVQELFGDRVMLSESLGWSRMFTGGQGRKGIGESCDEPKPIVIAILRSVKPRQHRRRISLRGEAEHRDSSTEDQDAGDFHFPARPYG